MIYTIGYQTLRPKRLLEIADQLGISTVIDCRCTTRSRVAGFGGLQLSRLLNTEHTPDRYVHCGRTLGGRGNVTAEGIDWLRRTFYADAPDGRNGLLLCMEEGPWDCHRHHDIVREHFPNALHIYSELLYSPADIEQAMRDGRLPSRSRGEVFPSTDAAPNTTSEGPAA